MSEKAVPEAIEGLTEGRIVHYVLPDGPCEGEHRPAIIVRVWDRTSQSNGCSNLQVFMDSDGVHDWNDGPINLLWATSRCFSEAKEPGTWHWIEKA